MGLRVSGWQGATSVALLASIAMLLAIAACGGGDPSGAPDSSGSELSGEIVIDGSSTVYPITVAAAEDFRVDNPEVQISVGISGTGGGFKKFASGETVISDASRPIRMGEHDSATANGVEYLELTVAYDGLSVMINPRNDFVECLTTGELNRIWEPASAVRTWRDVRAEWPAEEIKLYGPDSESGTFDYFTEEINGDTGLIRQDFVPAVDDNVLVQGIAGDRYSLGYFGYAYYAANRDKLKLVAVDSGSGCTSPSSETINGGVYSPLSRPLYIYVSIPALERPEVRGFVNYYLEHASALAASVGYVGLPQTDYDRGLALVADPEPHEPRSEAPAVDSKSGFAREIAISAATDIRVDQLELQHQSSVYGAGGGCNGLGWGEAMRSDGAGPLQTDERIAGELASDARELQVGDSGALDGHDGAALAGVGDETPGLN